MKPSVRLAILVMHLAACKYSLNLLGAGDGKSGPVPAVLRVAPADYSSAVGTNARIIIRFNTAMSLASLTANQADTACNSVVQISSDNFSTCVRLAKATEGVAGDTYAVLTPVALSPNTRYKIRVTTGARSQGNQNLAGVFTSEKGFTTGASADTRAPKILASLGAFIFPPNLQAAVPVNAGIALTFQESVDETTVTTNTGDTACSGSLQLSSDGFSSCVRMKASIAGSFWAATYETYPLANLSPNTAYQIRVTTAVKDLAGNAMATNLTTSFTTGSASANSAFSVDSTTPVDGASNVSLAPQIIVGFTTGVPVSAATLTTNSLGSECTGSIQLSGNNFASCVPLAFYYVGQDYENVSVYPLEVLDTGRFYKIRLTSAVTDIYGTPLAAFVLSTGFQTALSATGGTVVDHTHPFHSSAVSEIYTPFTVVYSKPMNPATVTTITSGTTCSGSLRVATSATCVGATCLAMSFQPIAEVGNTRFTVYAQSPVSPNSMYYICSTIAALDAGGFATTASNSTVTTIP